MPDLLKIRKEALYDIIKDIKVMKTVCYPYEDDSVDCTNCEHYNLCKYLLGINTPKVILKELKQKGVIR